MGGGGRRDSGLGIRAFLRRSEGHLQRPFQAVPIVRVQFSRPLGVVCLQKTQPALDGPTVTGSSGEGDKR